MYYFNIINFILFRLEIVFFVIVGQIIIALCYEEEDTNALKTSERPQVEVRAVFINCQPEVLIHDGIRFMLFLISVK